MPRRSWDDSFERTLRACLPLLGPGAPLPPGEPLADWGLDSAGRVELVLRLEETCGAVFTDDLLVGGTFATAAALWDALLRARTAAAGGVR
jgi:hypothetical protein